MALRIQPTPSEIARFGHIAALLREKMAEAGWTKNGELNRALGLDSSNSITHKWLHSKGAPGPMYRARLAKLFKLKPEAFAARTETVMGAKIVELDQPQLPAVRRSAIVPDVLSFNVGADGTARLRLDVSLPVDQGVPLLRVLLDAGLIVSRGTRDGAL